MLKFALRTAKRGWTLQGSGRVSVRLLSSPFKSATSSEKQRLEAIRKQGESRRRAYSLEKREESRDLQYILRVSSEDLGVSSAAAPESELAEAETEQQGKPATPEVEVGEAPAEAIDAQAKAEAEYEPVPADVYTVDNVTQAQRVVALLSSRYKDKCYACDTEVADIDVKTASPVGHGKMISFSLFCGPDAHFGVGVANGSRQSKIWVDLLDCDDREGILQTFKPFMEDPSIKKVWHNYSFDRHIFANDGIQCRGFFGDTMHMARLYDSSRLTKGGYSLESLSGDSKLLGEKASLFKKTSMKEIFGKPNIKKDGTEGKLVVLPPVDELQQGEETRGKWIKYCTLDAEATWNLYQALEGNLFETDCIGDGVDMQETYRDLVDGRKSFNMYEFYANFWRPFGSLLTDMEQVGVLADQEHLAKIEKIATEDQIEAQTFFREWASERVPDARLMNIGSALQLRQLLFAGALNQKTSEAVEMVRVFKVPNETGFIEEGKKKPKKNIDIELHGLWGKDVRSPLPVEHTTPSGWPGANTPMLRGLAGTQGVAKKLLRENTSDLSEKEAKELGLGTAYTAFGGGREGLRACAAMDALCDVAAIDTLLSNFIIPLQGDAIKCSKGRIHCSMNINTETGRLSARRPNLQNQPALEKDRYKIRQAFTADVKKGKTLIVADYGQLELRLLAHMTGCVSMLDAFERGGDFHSRTALGMYEHIQEAVDKGECLLEWKGGADGDEPPVPLIKDMFAAERRKAKVLNFSIAYGKTAHGLAKDWKVSLREADETLNRWYRDRPEVKTWQDERIVEAHQLKSVRTLLGRQRHLHQINSRNSGVRKHLERAAINTPIQGGAADIATLAMLEIQRNKELNELGWTLLLQVHDEVMLEGPAETKDRALQLVRHCMEYPFHGTNPLSVALNVDAKSADTWFDAK
ncbi:DNA polymerase I [Chloropicon primus]|nr:DNA polymerase I [Chloropicon primus]UPQ98380.1 DNA polymerase I [Chloropicon primus]|eukprot:QDZ19172.1 DNA polymerase I [Chloropicon primus]